MSNVDIMIYLFGIAITVKIITTKTAPEKYFLKKQSVMLFLPANIVNSPWMPRSSIKTGFSLDRANVELISIVISIPAIVDLEVKRLYKTLAPALLNLF